MTSMESLLVATRRKLLLSPSFSALIGTDVGKDPTGQAYNDGWVFKASDTEYSPDRNPRNTGMSSVTYGWRNSWTNPNVHNTLRFPHLEFRIFSDATRPRADSTLTARKDAEYRCDRVGTAIFDAFHDPANKNHWWPNDVYVVSCVLWEDLRIEDVPNQDGMVTGDMSFSVIVG